MKKVLVTGATGFVGSHLVERLLDKNYQVYAMVRSSSDTQHLQSLDIPLLEAELTDRASLVQVFKQLKSQQISIDYVVHCAATTKAVKLDQYMNINCLGTQILLDTLKQYQPDLAKFIFISSLAASGPTALDKTIQLKDATPVTRYGKSKLAAETVVKAAGLPYLILRPTAVYGPREKDIFTVFKMVHRGLHPLMGSKQQQLTFIYVKDLVDLILSGLRSARKNETFFVSDGQVYGKADLGKLIDKSLNKKSKTITIPLWLVKGLAYTAENITKLTGKTSPLNLEKYKELTASSWVCEVEPTFRAFEFQPAYKLEQGVQETSQWYIQAGWVK